MQALAEVKPDRPELGRTLLPLLELKGKSSASLKNLKALSGPDLTQLQPYIDDFTNIAELLEAVGCDYQIDLASGRGFEYYTGIIFQIFHGAEKIGGGGRYDALIPLMGGEDSPACGFALYLDRLMNLVKPAALAEPPGQKVLIRAKPEAVKEGFNAAERLREAGYRAELYLEAQAEADFGWTLDVQSKAPKFILTDRAKRKFEAQTVDEVLKLLPKV